MTIGDGDRSDPLRLLRTKTAPASQWDAGGLAWGTAARAFGAALVAVAIFQTVHLGEHLAQTWMWVSSPVGPAPMTALGEAANRLMASIAATGPTVTIELVHLVGNAVFLLGLLGLRRRVGGAVASPARLRWAVRVQFAHVLEHATLTLSALFLGGPLGLSTLPALLGGVEPSAATSWRVGLHLAVNVVATALAASACGAVRRRRALVATSR